MRLRVALLVLSAGLVPAALAQHGPPVPEMPRESAGGARPARETPRESTREVQRPAPRGAPRAERAAETSAERDTPPPTDLAPSDTPAPESPEWPRINASLSLDAAHAFEADFDNAPGSVGVSRFSAELDVSIALDERQAFIVSLSSEYAAYDFSDATGFVSGTSEPWDDVLEQMLSLTYRRRVSDQWSVLAGLSVRSSAEVGADFSDSLTYAARAGAVYALNEKTRLGLVVVVDTRLEDNTLFFAFPVIDWQFADRWSLRTSGSSRGARLTLGYQATEQLELGLGVGVLGREFRLDDNGPVPDGVARDLGVPVVLTARWTPTQQVTISAQAGAFVYRNLELKDANGDKITDLDADISPFVGVGVSFDF